MDTTTTSITLLNRVRDPSDAEAWQDFFQLYFPLIVKYVRWHGLNRHDAEETAQQCMSALARQMRDFHYSPAKGRFRGFLRKMVQQRIVDWKRRKRTRQARTGELEALAAPEETADDGTWERLWMREHLLYCVRRLESRYSQQTVEAFRLYALQDWPVARVCRVLGMTANQVYVAKTRMIRRLREDLVRLVGDVE